MSCFLLVMKMCNLGSIAMEETSFTYKPGKERAMKKTVLIVLIAICMIVFAACAAADTQQTVGEASASASEPPSESGLPVAFASPEESATSVMAASPEVSLSVASEAITKTVDKIIDVNALNSVFAADPKLAENGEQMIVGVSGNTLTYNLTFSKDISSTGLPADFKTTMENTLQAAIDQAAKLYPDLPDCTFVYNVINGVTGETILTVTKTYKAQ